MDVDSILGEELVRRVVAQRAVEQRIREAAEQASREAADRLDDLLVLAVEHPDVSITRLAELLGVTRDALYKRVQGRRERLAETPV